MPLKIVKAGTTYSIPMYTSKTAGDYINGAKHLCVRKGGVTYYINLYSNNSDWAYYPLKVKINGVIYQAGPAWNRGFHIVISKYTAGTQSYTVPANYHQCCISEAQVWGAGGGAAGQGDNYEYSPPTGNRITYYGGGGGGGAAGYQITDTYSLWSTPPGTIIKATVGAGGIWGFQAAGASWFEINGVVTLSRSGGGTGTRGGNATNGAHGNGGAGGTGRINGTAGAPGTSAGEGANGTGAAATFGWGGTVGDLRGGQGGDGYVKIMLRYHVPASGS